jgi:hypothetical protein
MKCSHSALRTRLNILLLVVLLAAGAALLAGLAPSRAHPFHVSLCQIDHNPDARSLEITFKLFTDDLEQALEAQGAGRLHLGTEQESEEADRYISRYLERAVQVEVNGKPAAWRFLGKEVELDATWCYAEAPEVSAVKTVSVTDTILLDLFEDQANLVHVKANKQQKSLLLNRANPRGTVEF